MGVVQLYRCPDHGLIEHPRALGAPAFGYTQRCPIFANAARGCCERELEPPVRAQIGTPFSEFAKALQQFGTEQRQRRRKRIEREIQADLEYGHD